MHSSMRLILKSCLSNYTSLQQPITRVYINNVQLPFRRLVLYNIVLSSRSRWRIQEVLPLHVGGDKDGEGI